MSDRFDESEPDLERFESIDDEVALEDVLTEIESLDDEFLPFVLDPIGAMAGGLGAAGNLMGNLAGAAQGAARGIRGPRPNVQQYPRPLPAARPGIPSPALSRTFATQAQVRALARQVDANRTAIQTVNKRAEVINNRVNTTEKKLGSEVTRLNAVNVAQTSSIQRQQKQIKGLREDLDKSSQTSLLLMLLGGGKKAYKIAEPADGIAGTKEVKLEPSGGKLDMLLPLLLLGGGGGKGGLFDNPLLLLVMAGAL